MFLEPVNTAPGSWWSAAGHHEAIGGGAGGLDSQVTVLGPGGGDDPSADEVDERIHSPAGRGGVAETGNERKR